MKARWTFVLTENLVDGRVVVGRYDHVSQRLQVGEEDVRIADWFPLAELAKVVEQEEPWQELYGYDPADADLPDEEDGGEPQEVSRG